MEKKRISFGQGKGSLTHNNRVFVADNVDRERIKDNITFKAQPIQEAYQQLFGEAVERHNAQQKRNARKFDDYYKHVFKRDYSNNVIQSNNGEKSFYEDIMQIGKMEDTACGTPDAEIAKQCLIEYMNGFQERNPNFYVFNAVLHLDEATPHLHFDYIPVGHYEGKKLDTRNSISRALEEMGFGYGKQSIAKWREREWGVMHQICLNHGIEIARPEKRHESMTVQEYKQYKDTQAQRIAEEEKLSELKQQRVIEEHMLKEASSLTTKIKNIDNIETGKTLFGGKVTVSSEEYENLVNLAKRQVADVTKEKKAVKENEQLKKEVAALTKQNTAMSAELDELKKPKPATMSIKTLKEEDRKMREREGIKSKLKKAESFIEACGLYDEYQRYRPNTKNRNYGLE